MKNTNIIRSKMTMLGLFLAAFTVAFIGIQTAQATLLDTGAGVGQFNFTTEGQVMGATGDSYFSNGGSGSSSSVNFTANSRLTRLGYNLGFGNFPANAKGMKFPAVSPQTGKIRGHLLSAAQAPTAGNFVYMTCLLRVNTAPSALRGLLGLDNNTSNPSSVQPGVHLMVDPTGKIGISKTSFTAIQSGLSATSLTGTGIHLVVMRYDFIGAAAGTDDTINLWIDPDLSTFGSAEGSVPAPNITIGAGLTDVSANGIRSVLGYTANAATAGGDIDVDEIRVGTLWADVLPTPVTCVAPVVTNSSPAAITINDGLTVTLNSTLTVGDNAGILPTLQWQRWDGSSTWTNLVNATNSSYTTPTLVVANDNGAQYRLSAFTACSSTTTNSTTNTLTVVSCDNLALVTGPVSPTIQIGASTNLAMAVSGSLPIYQWQQWDGVSTFTNISGATSSTYTTPALQLSDSGVQYRCHVVSGCNGSTVDASCTVNVSCGNAAVALNPASTTTTVGAPAIFTVGYSGPAPVYQWQSSSDGGSTFADLSGETYSSFTNTSAALASPSAQYRCVLTAVCSSTTATSAPAILTVVAPSAAKFRSVASGNWSAPATWQCSYDGGTTWTNTFASPSDANDTIAVRSPHSVTVNSAVSVDQTTVDVGATLTVSSGVTVTISGAGTQLDVSGVLINAGTVTPTGDLVFEGGGKYQHTWTTSLSGGIPTATWKTNSTCEVIGFTTPTGTWSAGNLGQAFYNFTWDCANYVGGNQIVLNHALTTVNGDFKHKHGNLTLGGSSGSGTLTVGGNMSFEAPLAFGYFIFGSATDIQNFVIGGYLSILNGTRVDPGNPGNHTITFTGTNCFYTNSAGSRFDGHEIQPNWSVAPGAKLTLATPIISGSTAVGIFRTVNVDGTLDLNGNNLTALEIKGGSTGVITNSSATAARALLGFGSGGPIGNFVSLPDSFDGAIKGNISVLKHGVTTITLNGANTYIGTTTVTNGILVVNGSLDPASPVTVNNAATLSGAGTIGGATTIGSTGILNAGTNGLGTLTFSGDLTLDAAASSVFSITSSGSNAVNVVGTLTPNSSVIQVNSDSALATGTYPLFTHYGSISGSFGTTSFNNPPAGSDSIVASANVINLVIGAAGPSGPGTINYSIGVGNTLNLTWPTGQGWRLESQTNNLSAGLTSGGWGTVSGVSDGSATITISPSSPSVFFRLAYP